jgi:hypothetical protein
MLLPAGVPWFTLCKWGAFARAPGEEFREVGPRGTTGRWLYWVGSRHGARRHTAVASEKDKITTRTLKARMD